MAMKHRSVLIALSVAILMACASARSPRDQTLAGLEQKPRLVTLTIDDTPPKRNFVVRESQVGKEAVRGSSKAALGTLQGAAQTLDPIVMAVGIVLTPVFAVGGAVAGAVSAKPLVHHYPLDKVEGARPLYEAATKQADFITLLKSNLLQEAAKLKSHNVRFLEKASGGGTTETRGDVQLVTRVTTYSLSGKLIDDPETMLVIRGETTVEASWVRSRYVCFWSYKSPKRKLSRWRSDNARLFVREIRKGAAVAAEKILGAIQPRFGACSD